MLLIIYFVVAIVIIFILAISKANKRVKNELIRSRKLKRELAQLPNFTATRRVNGIQGFYIFAMDETNQKMVLLEEFRAIIFNFSDTKGVEIIEDGNVISKISGYNTETTNMNVESNIATHKKKISSILVKIILTDAKSSDLYIACFDAKTMTAKRRKSIKTVGNKESFVYENGKRNAFQIKSLIELAIESNNTLTSSIRKEKLEQREL